MAMTREERNARRVDLRAQTMRTREADWLSSLMELWIRARKDKMSLDAILAYRKQWIIGTEAYQQLPQWIKYKLEGAWDAYYRAWYRLDLVFCYPHPETGVITTATEICNAGLAQMLADKGLDTKGNHYWKNDDGTFTHPF